MSNPIGFVIVDRYTNKIDWDGELHPTVEAAIDSLTGPRQMWCKTPEEENEDKTYWATAYMLCRVVKEPQ